MAPVQRTAKAWVVVSVGWTGLAKAQSKSISLSMRTISGAPSKPGREKYSPFQSIYRRIAGGAEHGSRNGKLAAHDVGRALGVEDVVVAELLVDAVDGEDGVKRDGVVVAFERDARTGERTDDGDGLMLAGSSGRKWFSFLSRTIDSRAARRASSACSGESTTEYGIVENGTLLRRIEHAELHARGEEALDRDVELGFGQEAFVDSVGELEICRCRSPVSVPARMPAAEPAAKSAE